MLFRTVGKSEHRRDLPEKLTGEAQYAADVSLPGMLFGRILRSPHPHARIVSVDTADTGRLTGVRAILTPFDVPRGRIAPDVAILDTEVRFVGDEVAAVAADDEDVAEEALSLIKAEYELLPFVTDARQALQPDAPLVHAEAQAEGHSRGNLIGGQPLTLTRGNVDEGFARADVIVEDTFTTPAHSGAALEPRAAVAAWEGDELTVWKSSRGVHSDQLSLSLALEIPREKVRVIGVTMGAGYGNKDESRLAAITSILARRAGRPVKIELSRQEEFGAGRHRHATVTTVRMGVTHGGEITAIQSTTIMDTGAYLYSGPGVVRRAGQGALYLYRLSLRQCPLRRIFLTYTNTPSAGSYRALGAPQGHFALEVLSDRAAEALEMDPLEFRLRNHVGPEGQPGERVTPPDETVDTQPVEGGVPFSSNGLRECLERGASAIGWKERRGPQGRGDGSLRRGMGIGMFIYRGGPGGRSTARMTLDSDGSINLFAGVMDVGEGNLTAVTQIASEALGVDLDQVSTTFGDTALTPVGPITAGSTATFSTGLAAHDAAEELRRRILETAAPLLHAEPSDLELSGRFVALAARPELRVPLAKVGEASGGLTVEISVAPGSKDYVVNSFGAHFAEVEVDTDTGQVRVLRYVAAHDSGRILNPNLAINQVEGGVSQMLGFTLYEQMLTDPESGATLNASFLEHKSPTTLDYPDIQVIFADVVDPVGPYGLKGLGEPPSIGVAPAIANAIYDATGVRVRDLPATPDRILDGVEALDRGDSQ